MGSYLTDPRVQRRRWGILLVVAMLMFMATLDASIVNIALPAISRDLHIPMNQAEWIVSVYLVTTCILLLQFGRLGDTHGKIKVFKWGTVLFTVGSLGCAAHFGLGALLLARVVQALGAAMTMSTSNGIVTEVFPVTQRGQALGTVGSIVALGSIAGPGVGGLILAHFNWNVIFLINVPIGLAMLIIGQVVLPADVTFKQPQRDLLGSSLFILATLAFFLAVFWGQVVGFTHLGVVALFVGAGAGYVGFTQAERHAPTPLLSLRFLRRWRFTVNLISAFLLFVTTFFFTVVAPFYLENARGLSANQTGYLLMVTPFIQMCIAPFVGRLTNVINPQGLVATGLTLVWLGQWGYLGTGLTSPLWQFVGWVALVGLGVGLVQAPVNTLMMAAVDTKDLGLAGGLASLGRQVGMVVGIALATTVLFAAMSRAAGRPVTTYLATQPAVFISGMHVAFKWATVICAGAALLAWGAYLKDRGHARTA